MKPAKKKLKPVARWDKRPDHPLHVLEANAEARAKCAEFIIGRKRAWHTGEGMR